MQQINQSHNAGLPSISLHCLRALRQLASVGATASLAVLVILFSSTVAHGQKCKKLKPAGDGQDDAARINDCLATKGRAKLKAGTFLLHSPIVFPKKKKDNDVSSVRLEGKGMDATRLVAVQPDCARHWPFAPGDAVNRYQAAIQVIRSPAAAVSNLELDVTGLRRDCNYHGEYMIIANDSPAVEVSGVRMKGSRYGSADYTSGGANSGGILVVNSEASAIAGNEIADVGFTFQIESLSASFAGISIQSSRNSRVENNRITRVSFGINVMNGAPELGYNGNSSGTVIRGNTIIGAANINCPDCSQGRAIKLQACGATGTEPPLENIVVSDNIATEYGGANGNIAGSGLDLVCGVRLSRFENNKFIGGPTAEFGLQVRGSFLSPINPTYHNTFNFNTFLSGRGQPECRTNCSDVHFTPDGSDQIGIRRNGADRKGTNEVGNFRISSNRGCNDYAHAFYLYMGDRNLVRQGEELLLTATGVRPNTTVTFRFRRAGDDSEVLAYTGLRANNNCIMNQELLVIDPAKFAPGYYKIFAQYQDGNTDNVFITEDHIGTIRVKPRLE